MQSETTIADPTVLADYAEKGVVHLPNFFDRGYARELEAMWKQFKGQMEANAVSNTRNNRFIYGLLTEPIGSIYQHPKLVALMSAMLGTDDVALYMNRLLVKDGAWNGSVTIHQDMPYYNGGLTKIAVFVPLQPIQAVNGNGGLTFVLGSHHYGNLQRGAIDRTQFAPMTDYAPSIEVGDVVLMNFLTWHYSTPSVTGTDRPLLQLTYQPASDGSYASTVFGVAEPTLVSGVWRTKHFTEWNRGIIPDA